MVAWVALALLNCLVRFALLALAGLDWVVSLSGRFALAVCCCAVLSLGGLDCSVESDWVAIGWLDWVVVRVIGSLCVGWVD